MDVRKRKTRRKVIVTNDDEESSPDYIDMFACYDDRYPCFINAMLTDDLLAAEILPRVFDCRAAVRCGAVCKRWRSFIAAPEFIPNFRPPPTYTMLIDYRVHRPPFYEYALSPWSVIVTGSNVTAALAKHHRRCAVGFVLKSTCNDLILLAREEEEGIGNLCIVNYITGESLLIPRGHNVGPCVALVSRPDEFRIVDIALDADAGEIYSTVFSSKTAQWSDRALAPDLSEITDLVAEDGLLYWLHYDDNKRLVIFDPFQQQWTYIPLPPDLLLDSDLYHGLPVELGSPQEVFQLGSSKYRLHIGAVQGRIRLAQLFRAEHFVLKIWELINDVDFSNNNDDKAWRLMSEVKLSSAPQRSEWIYFFSFDAEDRDVVFLCCDRDVYRYCMGRGGQYERVLELYCRHDDGESINKRLPRFAHVNIVRHPAWHSSLPRLPSASLG